MNAPLYPQVDLTLNKLVENSSTVIDLHDQNLKLTQSNKTLFLIIGVLGVAFLVAVVIYADKSREDDEQTL